MKDFQNLTREDLEHIALSYMLVAYIYQISYIENKWWLGEKATLLALEETWSDMPFDKTMPYSIDFFDKLNDLSKTINKVLQESKLTLVKNNESRNP